MNNANTVQILFGAEGIKRVYEDSLREGSLDIVCLASDYQSVLGDSFDRDYAPRLRAQVKTREILADIPGNKAGDKVRLLPLGKSSESDMLISKNKVVLISYGKLSPLVVVITDSELVNGFQNQFNALWAGLE